MGSDEADGGGHPIVVVRQTDHQPLFVQLRNRIELGRECNGLLLADPLVSRRHVALSGAAGSVLVGDLGSTNGTFLDGARVDGRATLAAGSVLKFGSTTVELVDAPGSAAPAAPGGPARRATPRRANAAMHQPSAAAEPPVAARPS